MKFNSTSNKKTILASAVSIAILSGCGGGSSSSDPQPTPVSHALISTIDLPVGNDECVNGGIKVIAGYDENNNDILEGNEYESNQVICNDGTRVEQEEGKEIFEEALVAIAYIAKNDERCASGGQQIFLGLDANSNKLLDHDEISSTEILCSVGADFAPEPIINAITANPAIVSIGGSTVLTATISNLLNTDSVIWQDADGNEITPDDAGSPNVITVTVGDSVGQEVYTLSLVTKDADGNTVVHKKNIVITVAEAPASTQSVVLNTQQVFLPEGYTTSTLTGDVHGSIIYAEPISTSDISSRSIPTPEQTDLAGFVAEKQSLNGDTSSLEMLESSMSAFTTQIFGNVVQTSQAILSNGDVSATYKIKLYQGQKLTELLSTLIEQVALNKVGGSASVLVPSASEIPQENYQLDISVSYNATSDVGVITTTLISDEKIVDYNELIVSTTSEVIKAPTDATLELANDSFVAVDQAASKADFLFVIDNSGSMSDEQTAISKLTQSFSDTFVNSGIDFMVGTITTDSDELRGVGFTNDIVQLEDDFKPGTSGSARERGIYYSELALSSGGTVDLSGYPREGASMSVVIMSDEESQYQRYTNDPEFDPNNNLFVDNGYRVYSLVQPSDARDSQYDDLSTSTFGKTLNIDVTEEYQSFVETMAQNAGAISAGYKLVQATQYQVVSSSIKVTVNGLNVERNALNGWQYYPLSQSIVFSGSAIPVAGANIVMAYQYVK